MAKSVTAEITLSTQLEKKKQIFVFSVSLELTRSASKIEVSPVSKIPLPPLPSPPGVVGEERDSLLPALCRVEEEGALKQDQIQV